MLREKQIPLIYLLLTVAALIAFWQVNQCDFINYDDPVYVTENIHIQSGITMEAIGWAFTTGYAANWHPLTWMSHMLDVQLFGLKPQWHHLTNLLFHIANTLLIFFVFHRMTKAPSKSAFVAALFALHPLHVESVAWVAERKDVLSAFFWMLTLVAYIHYVAHPRLKNYLAVLMFFALGLMAKPMLVTLPFVLLLLDYWPLERLQKFQWASIRPLIWEKIPLLALAALSCIVTYAAQKKGGSVASLEGNPLAVRIANAFVSYIIYIGKTIWPSDLAVFYPYPGWWPLWLVIGAALLLIAVTLFAIWKADRLPYLAFGWLWFAGTLVPVIGIVQVGAQARADRYTYIPLIGLFIAAAWGIPELLKKWRYSEKALFAMWALILPCLFIATWKQAGYWSNSIELYDHALNITGHNDTILTNRGVAYGKLGNYRQAISDYDSAIEINPQRGEAYNDRGLAYGKLGNHRQAISDYNRAIEINPENADAYCNRGISYSKLGNYRQAIADFDRAMEIDPKLVPAYNGRGTAYARLGNLTQAISDYGRTIEIDPKFADAYNNRGVAYGILGNNTQAIQDYDRAIEINPDYADAYFNRGVAYGGLGNHRQAISDYDRTIEIDPKYADAYNNRGAAYGKLGNQRQAIEDLQKAARFDNEDAKNSLRSIGISW